MPSSYGEAEWRKYGETKKSTKKPPEGGFTTLLIALIILLVSHGARGGT